MSYDTKQQKHEAIPITEQRKYEINGIMGAINCEDRGIKRMIRGVLEEAARHDGRVMARHITGKVVDTYRKTRALLKAMCGLGLLEKEGMVAPMKNVFYPGKFGVVMYKTPPKGWQYVYRTTV